MGWPRILRHDGETIDVRRAALIRAHAERRVALQMLNRTEAFAGRQFDVVCRHIVLKIDETLGASRARGHAPERLRRAGRNRRGMRGGEAVAGRKARLRGRGQACGVTLRQRAGQVEAAVRRARPA